jgi:hypothetical protein
VVAGGVCVSETKPTAGLVYGVRATELVFTATVHCLMCLMTTTLSECELSLKGLGSDSRTFRAADGPISKASGWS